MKVSDRAGRPARQRVSRASASLYRACVGRLRLRSPGLSPVRRVPTFNVFCTSALRSGLNCPRDAFSAAANAASPLTGGGSAEFAYSLKRLGLDYLDIYRPARLDPAVPIEDSIGAIAELLKQGYVRYIGLSEVGPDTIRRAQAVHPIADLQIEYSLISRGIEHEIIPTCRDPGIGITAYGVLSRGLISGHWHKDSPRADFRARAPRFQGANLDCNRALVERLRAVARAIGVSVAQVAIAWVIARALYQRVSIVPLIGAQRRDRLEESLGALALRLSAEQLADIERAVPPSAAGGRYPDVQLAHMDSERRAPS